MELLERVIMWEEVKVTGIIFISGLIFLISCLHYSVISVISNIGLFVSLSSLATKLYVHLMGFMKKPCKDIFITLDTMLDLDKETQQQLIKTTVEKASVIGSQLRSLILVHNFENSTKFCILLYCLSYLGKKYCNKRLNF